MTQPLAAAFHWLDEHPIDATLAPFESYAAIAAWALAARRTNPLAFDAVTTWLNDDAQWTPDTLAANEQILMHDIIGRFKAQNAALREILRQLEPSGVVNDKAFEMLDDFDAKLSGKSFTDYLQAPVAAVFTDFSAILNRGVRDIISGSELGPIGNDVVDVYGYINCLNQCDLRVQWTLFMPSFVERQLNGFTIESFEYKTLPALRFIGLEAVLADVEARRQATKTLDALSDYKSGFDYGVELRHHNGESVDEEPLPLLGRFMAADTPVPQGFTHIDFVPKREDAPNAGPPYLSQFAFAVFGGDVDAMHVSEGYDAYALYDVTRNIMLGQGVSIPYPTKYWTGEVFLDGFENPGTAYVFSAEL